MKRLKVDENLPPEVATLLREAGHDATTVTEQGLGGQPDREVARRCREEQRAVVTLDVDFSVTPRRTPSCPTAANSSE